jgi:hypothetical protein
MGKHAMRGITLVLAVLLLLAEGAPALAQLENAPTDCTESMTIGTIFIGHDCGEWASVVISGRVVMRKPWSRANRASRAARLRARREAGAIAPPAPTAAPATTGAVMLFGIDVSGGANPTDLDCDDFTFREDAEALWAAQGWSAADDPHHLDGLGDTVDDGLPCEGLRTRQG